MAVSLGASVSASPDSQSVTLDIIASPDDFSGQFDVLEVWRSRETAQGMFEELTAEAYKSARLPRSAQDPPTSPVAGGLVYVTGQTLALRVNEDEDLEILLTGVDPLSLGDVASQITSKSLGKLSAYVDELGVLAIQTNMVGTGAALRVLECEVASLLGLSIEEPESLDFGHNAWMPLVESQELYRFIDILGSSEYFYRTRFRNTQTGAVSRFSDTFSPENVVGIDSELLAIGELDLIDIRGVPLVGHEVRVFAQHTSTIVDNRLMVGSDLIERSDAEGHVEFQLLRGQKVSVAIEGTPLTRDIVVPADTSIKRFNLLDPTVGAGDDAFKVQVPNIVYAERRSL